DGGRCGDLTATAQQFAEIYFSPRLNVAILVSTSSRLLLNNQFFITFHSDITIRLLWTTIPLVGCATILKDCDQRRFTLFGYPRETREAAEKHLKAALELISLEANRSRSKKEWVTSRTCEQYWLKNVKT
ncbi:hypothetical protein BC938DRAFT_471188, partial [Jimgerdemannia flammicorona]